MPIKYIKQSNKIAKVTKVPPPTNQPPQGPSTTNRPPQGPSTTNRPPQESSLLPLPSWCDKIRYLIKTPELKSFIQTCTSL